MESEAFPDGGIVPPKYAGRGGVQPGFKFSGAPAGTVSYAIIFHDLDVAIGGNTGDVLHWIAWNIPASANGIPEGLASGGISAGSEHHGPERVLRSWRARGPAVSPLRVRAVRVEREPGSAGHVGPR